MQIVVEFYRTREMDDAHAVVDRDAAEAADLEDAVKIARRLSQTLNMPQRPNALKITDRAGAVRYTSALGADLPDEERTHK